MGGERREISPQKRKTITEATKIKISCKAINGAKFYPVKACPHDDPTAPWVQVSVDSKCRQTITGLTPGVEYALRIAAKGAAGQSPWGDEAVCLAP